MFYFKRKKVRHLLAAGVLFALCAVKPCLAGATDIYLVYSGANKEAREQMQDALPEALDVKSYNAYLLAIADYSGKQKVIAKLSQARVIVVLDKDAKKAFENTKFSNVIYAAEGDTKEHVSLILRRLDGETQ